MLQVHVMWIIVWVCSCLFSLCTPLTFIVRVVLEISPQTNSSANFYGMKHIK